MKKEISEAINTMRGVSSKLWAMVHADDKADAKALGAAADNLAALNAELAQNDELIKQNDRLLAELAVVQEEYERSADLLERWFLMSTGPLASKANDHTLISVPPGLIADTESFVTDDEDFADIDSPAGLGGTIVDLDDFGDDGGTPLSDIRPEDFGEPAGPDYTGS